MSTQTPDARSSRSGFHPVSIGHLVMGLALLGLVGVWALVEGGAVENDDLRWLLPVPFLVAGLAGLAATAITGTRRHGSRQTGWVGLTDPARPSERHSVTNPHETPETPE